MGESMTRNRGGDMNRGRSRNRSRSIRQGRESLAAGLVWASWGCGDRAFKGQSLSKAKQ